MSQNQNYKIVFDAVLNKSSIQKQLSEIGNSPATKKSAQSLGDIFTKVLKFNLATQVINKFKQGISDAISEVYTLNKSFEELDKVVNLSTQQMSDYKKEITDAAQQMGVLVSDLNDAVTTFVKTGKSLEESQALAEVAVQMQHTADETLEAADAGETLIAVMSAWNMGEEQADHIADAINGVSANFAISSGQIIKNITKVSSTMSVGNTTMEETLGLMTGITEQTRNASQAANA